MFFSQLVGFLVFLSLQIPDVSGEEDDCWPRSNCCPFNKVKYCNGNLTILLDKYLELPETAFAQRCEKLRMVSDLASECINMKYMTDWYCKDEILEMKYEWQEMIPTAQLEECDRLICDSPLVQATKVDQCLSPVEGIFHTLETLCSNENAGPILTNARSCVKTALSPCDDDLQIYWNDQIQLYADELTSPLTVSVCTAMTDCSDVEDQLDKMFECHKEFDIGTQTFSEFCTELFALTECMALIDDTCPAMNEIRAGKGSTIYPRMERSGCLGVTNENVCNLITWLDCYKPVRDHIGEAYFNFKNEELELYYSENVNWASICNKYNSTMDTKTAEEMGRCAREQYRLCRPFVYWLPFNTSDIAREGRFKPRYFLNSLDPDFLPMVKARVCGNPGCLDMRSKLNNVVGCTAGENLGTMTDCSSLNEIMICVVDEASTCPVLHMTLKAQIKAIPNLNGALTRCAIYPALLMACVNEDDRIKSIHTYCYKPLISTCDELQSHIDCVLRDAVGCDYLLHTYFDQYRVDLNIYSTMMGCNLDLDEDLVTSGCDYSRCYSGILGGSLPDILINKDNLPPEFVIMNTKGINCDSMGLFKKALECEAQVDECVVRQSIYNAPRALNISKMIHLMDMFCTKDKQCPKPREQWEELQLSLKALKMNYKLLSSNVRIEKEEFGTTEEACKPFVAFVKKYEKAAFSCKFITNDMLYSMLDDRDWKALQLCQVVPQLLFQGHSIGGGGGGGGGADAGGGNNSEVGRDVEGIGGEGEGEGEGDGEEGEATRMEHWSFLQLAFFAMIVILLQDVMGRL